MPKYKKYEIELCECGHMTPVEFIQYDKDGIATCANCIIEHLTMKLKQGKSKSNLKIRS